MFNHFSRMRLMLRDSAEDQTENTRVLVGQRTGWVMLLAAFLALLCLPIHRGFMSDQAMRALARKKPGWMTARPPTSSSTVSSPAASTTSTHVPSCRRNVNSSGSSPLEDRITIR